MVKLDRGSKLLSVEIPQIDFNLACPYIVNRAPRMIVDAYQRSGITAATLHATKSWCGVAQVN